MLCMDINGSGSKCCGYRWVGFKVLWISMGRDQSAVDIDGSGSKCCGYRWVGIKVLWILMGRVQSTVI